MKYINREYGLAGRPPYFKEFHEENVKGPAVTYDCFLTRPIVGFGLENKVPNGALLAGTLGSIWGVEFNYMRKGKWTTDSDFIDEVGKFIATSTNNRFRYLCHGGLAVTMVKYSKNAIVLSFSALEKIKLKLSFYPITKMGASMKLSSTRVMGQAPKRAVLVGETSHTDNSIIARDRYEAVYDNSEDLEFFLAQIVAGTDGEFTAQNNAVNYDITLDAMKSRLQIYCAIGDASIFDGCPSQEELARGVNNAELTYSADKVIGSGMLASHVSEIYSHCAEHEIFNPLTLDCVYVESRNKVDEHYAFDPTDMAIGGLISSYTSHAKKAQIKDYSDEVVMGAMATWVAFCRTRDKNILAEAYPKWAKKWDIDDSLICVDQITKREIGYKMEGSPLKDIKAEPIYSLEFNTYKLIALEVMTKAARVLGLGSEVMQLNAILISFIKKFNDTLFNKKLGRYCDRYLRGNFAVNYGATAFLPLVTAAVRDNDKLDMLLINLVDEKKFWGDSVVPTISKDNASYGKWLRKADGKFRAPFEGYTGSILPQLNYMIYMGLVRQGVLDIEAKFAEISVKTWEKYYNEKGIIPSIYLPNGKLDSQAQKNSLSGNLMGLIGITELIDVEYFRDDLRPAIRFGTLAEGEHRISNVKLFGKKMDLAIVDNAMTLHINDVKAFESVGGRVVVRNYNEKESGVEFMLFASSSATITFISPAFVNKDGEGATYRFNVEIGKYLVKAKDGHLKLEKMN